MIKKKIDVLNRKLNIEKKRQLSTKKKKMYKKENIIIAELYGSAMNTIYTAKIT